MAVYNQKKHAGRVALNSYVPAMQFAADIQEAGVYLVNFGSPPAAATIGIITTMAQDTAVDVGRASFDSTTAYLAEATFGATIRIIGTTTNTAAVAVYGRDFYGQPMKETLALNSDTAVAGVKVFKTIDRVTCGASASDTFSMGWGGIFGLPYKTTHCLGEIADGVPAAAGTLTAPVLTDPQTATTGDPRGRYTPTTTPDGSKDLTGIFIADNSINAAGNGGLMGIAHYNAA